MKREFAVTTGSNLRCKGWRQEGLLRLLENVLAVGEDPNNLVVYAALGRAARDWPSHDKIVETLTAGSPSYVAGSSKLNGVTVADPTVIGSTWNWSGTLNIAAMGSLGSMADGISKMLLGGWSSDKVGANFFGNAMSQWLSPYQSNPLDINPLRKLLQAEIDFPAIASLQLPKTFVSATHVNTGQAEIFSGKRLTLQAVMASTCLPTLFQAVEIGGQSYWDGGFSSNPSLLPLISECSSRDIIVVQINPLRRPEVPHTPHDIMDRVNELTFNASLLSQMRTIDFINRLLADGRLQEGAKYKSLLLHRIDGGEALENLPPSSKLSADGAMIEKLFEMGQGAAKRWLRRHFEALGLQSTVNIRRDYVGSLPQEF